MQMFDMDVLRGYAFFAGAHAAPLSRLGVCFFEQAVCGRVEWMRFGVRFAVCGRFEWIFCGVTLGEANPTR